MALFIYTGFFIKQICDVGCTLCVVIDSFFYLSTPALSPTYSLYHCVLTQMCLLPIRHFSFLVIPQHALKLWQTCFCQTWYYFNFSSEYQPLTFLSNKADLALMSRKSRKADFTTYHYFSAAERHAAFPVTPPEWRSDCMSRHTEIFLRIAGVHGLA